MELHNNLLINGSDEIRSNFAFKYAILTSEAGSDIGEDVFYNIALKNIKILIKKYSPEVFDEVYRFIEKNIKSHYNDCFLLFKEVLVIENNSFKEISEGHKWSHMYWRGYLYFEEIFKEVFIKNQNDFLNCFELVMNINDSGWVTRYLIKMSDYFYKIKDNSDRIEQIFNKLVEISPTFYDLRERWKSNDKN